MRARARCRPPRCGVHGPALPGARQWLAQPRRLTRLGRCACRRAADTCTTAAARRAAEAVLVRQLLANGSGGGGSGGDDGGCGRWRVRGSCEGEKLTRVAQQ
eukprot:4589525-Prymnesium_polylepis.1